MKRAKSPDHWHTKSDSCSGCFNEGATSGYQRGLREGEVKGLLRAARMALKYGTTAYDVSLWCRAEAKRLKEKP